MKNSIVAVTSFGLLALAGRAGFDVIDEASAANAEVKSVANTPVADSANQASIKFSGKSIAVTGKGATVKDNRVTITTAGTYRISGQLSDGQVIVDTPDKQRVKLILNNASISSSTDAPLEIRQAEKVEIELADGSANQVTDTAKGSIRSADAALYSREDLTLSGNGALQVRSSSNNGIVSNDSLKISGGHITVNAMQDGIKGKDSLVIGGGVININAGADGLQSSNNTDAGRGVVRIDAGTLNIVAALDGIQAATTLNIQGGVVTVAAGGGAAGKRYQGSGSAAVDSMKGLKAGVALVLKGGKLSIDAADDGINSNDSVTIDGGQIHIAAGGQGIRANQQVQINGGATDIVQSSEGVESPVVAIKAGSLRVVSADDGINITPGGQSFGFGRQAGGASTGSYLAVRGGYVVVDSGGDGIDANSGTSIEMTGGTLLVNGPAARMNSALDYDGSFRLTGGLLVAVGSASMAQAPGSASTQNSVRVILPAMQSADTPVHIATESGKALVTFVPAKAYQSVVVSSPELRQGETYVVYTGGQATGKMADGLYAAATYKGGAEVARFTVSGVVTDVGSGGGGGGRNGRRW